MEMIDRLTGIGAGISDQPEPAPVDGLLLRDPGGHPADPADQLPILFGNLRQSGDMLLRDDQDMHRRPGINIPEGQDFFIFIDDLRRNVLIYNFAENTGHFIIIIEHL